MQSPRAPTFTPLNHVSSSSSTLPRWSSASCPAQSAFTETDWRYHCTPSLPGGNAPPLTSLPLSHGCGDGTMSPCTSRTGSQSESLNSARHHLFVASAVVSGLEAKNALRQFATSVSNSAPL